MNKIQALDPYRYARLNPSQPEISSFDRETHTTFNQNRAVADIKARIDNLTELLDSRRLSVQEKNIIRKQIHIIKGTLKYASKQGINESQINVNSLFSKSYKKAKHFNMAKANYDDYFKKLVSGELGGIFQDEHGNKYSSGLPLSQQPAGTHFIGESNFTTARKVFELEQEEKDKTLKKKATAIKSGVKQIFTPSKKQARDFFMSSSAYKGGDYGVGFSVRRVSGFDYNANPVTHLNSKIQESVETFPTRVKDHYKQRLLPGYTKDVMEGFATFFYKFPYKLVKGSGKIIYAPNWYDVQPAVDFKQGNVFKSDNLVTDADVQLVAGTIAGASMYFVAPALGYAMIGASTTYSIIKDPSPTTFGETVASFSLPTVVKGVTHGIIKPFKNQYLKFKSDYIPPEKVFDMDVITGKTTFPTTKSPQYTISSFEGTRTFSPNYGEIISRKTGDITTIRDVSGKFTKVKGTSYDLVGSHSTSVVFDKKTHSRGSSATWGEDDALYMTPKGKGSPYFLEIAESNTKYEYSINPLKDVLKSPNVVEIHGIKGIKRYPENIIQSKGFTISNSYLNKQVGSGFIFVSKRSEIGTRGLKGIGKGTQEMEGVLPKDTPMELMDYGSKWANFKGFKEYTTYKGEIVPLRRYSIGSSKTTKTTSQQAYSQIKKYDQSKIVYL